jgi:hypothetical protein
VPWLQMPMCQSGMSNSKAYRRGSLLQDGGEDELDVLNRADASVHVPKRSRYPEGCT